jgi:hypothetical protein
MHRTQISLDERHYEFLVTEARRARVSLAEVVRRLISERMDAQDDEDDPIERLAGIASGKGSPAEADAIARDHDQHLYG